MKKVLSSCLLGALLVGNITTTAFASDKIAELNPVTTNVSNISTSGSVSIDNFQVSKQYKDIQKLLNKLEKYTNKHDIEKLKTLYSKDYTNYDGLKQDDLFKMISKTWSNFPDVKFDSKIKNIRVNNNYATIESIDTATGTTRDKLELTDDTGILNSTSHNLLYLQKYGKNWKIVSDRVIFEKTILKYGKAKNISVDISAPDQVAANQNYTTTIITDIPEKMVALGSIAREPIVFPEVKAEEIFRQIPADQGQLERIVKANNTNNNELAVASIGYTELVQDFYQNLQVKVTGVALLMHRVNVIPKSTYINKVSSK